MKTTNLNALSDKRLMPLLVALKIIVSALSSCSETVSVVIPVCLETIEYGESRPRVKTGKRLPCVNNKQI